MYYVTKVASKKYLGIVVQEGRAILFEQGC